MKLLKNKQMPLRKVISDQMPDDAMANQNRPKPTEAQRMRQILIERQIDDSSRHINMSLSEICYSRQAARKRREKCKH